MGRSAELALHRFGLGARPGDIDGIGDPVRWLTAQTAAQPEPAVFADFPRAAEIIRDLPDRATLKDDKDARKD